MLSLITAALALLCSTASANSFNYPIIGAYFPNWAQYRQSPYTYTPQQMEPIISTLNAVWYGFAYFCPEPTWTQPYWVTQLNLCQGKQPMDVISIEPKDPQFYQDIINYKKRNPKLKVLLSVGGWNFPSEFYSKMVADSSLRSAFISSAKSFLQQYGFDGLDLDWEFPNSPPRDDEVKITCYQFDETHDDGGSPQDGQNFLQLVKEMRSSFGSEYLITIAAQADMTKANYSPLKDMDQYVDAWNLMSYDYSVSDITDANLTAPNQPLYAPPEKNIMQDSTASTIDGYLQLGISGHKINLGVAYYGHLWYVPGMQGTQWQDFALTAQIQGQCCGPFAQTYGAKYGKYSQLCGTYMYSEIQAAGFDTYFDNVTQSQIGYAVNPTDGYTEKGVWITYQGKETITALVDYAKMKMLGGAFAFDISMDSNDNGQFTYQLTHLIAQLEG